jgi:hypothetical protein
VASSPKLVCINLRLHATTQAPERRLPELPRRLRDAVQAAIEQLTGRLLLIDGYNLLITVEAALAGGVVLRARDGTYRDMASVHGTFRKVQETLPAIELIGLLLARHGATQCTWYLDSVCRDLAAASITWRAGFEPQKIRPTNPAPDLDNPLASITLTCERDTRRSL